MARKQPIGYEVRRPLTLWGKKRTIGEYLPASEVASMARIESMVRAGRFIEVFEKPESKALHGRNNQRPVAPVPAVEEPAVKEPVVKKRKPGRPKKVVTTKGE